jgi:prevent-host-death family protein
MRTIPAGEFKAKCLAIMDEVQAGGKPVLITKRGKPVVRLMPLESALERESRPIFGAWRGRLQIVDDIVTSQHSDEEWEGMLDEKFADL